MNIIFPNQIDFYYSLSTNLKVQLSGTNNLYKYFHLYKHFTALNQVP